MSINLPEPVAAYFQGKNKNDIDAMVAAFDDDALVIDEDQQFRGPAAIRAWMEEAARKYRFSVEVQTAIQANDETVVSGLVSGNFPGSPVLLRHTFTSSGTKIRSLTIT